MAAPGREAVGSDAGSELVRVERRCCPPSYASRTAATMKVREWAKERDRRRWRVRQMMPEEVIGCVEIGASFEAVAGREPVRKALGNGKGRRSE